MSTRTVHLGPSCGDAAHQLLGQILEQARERGIDQSALARQANLAPETLSRIKRSGRCRLTTALELARAAGMTSLTLHETKTSRQAVPLAARKLSAGRRVPIEPDDLVSALAGGRLRREHIGHVAGFFEELPLEMVHDVILDEQLHYARLHALALEVGAEGETVDWLAEMAGDGVAHAA